MKHKHVILPLALLIGGCSSAPRNAADVPVEHTENAYTVQERYPESAPDWARDFYKFRSEKDGKGSLYFLGESGDVNDRLLGCDVAGLQAKRKIAQQVASLISEKLALFKEGQLFVNKYEPTNNQLRQDVTLNLAQKSLALLEGVKESGVYWEERDYSKSGGQRGIYTCMVMAEISNHDMDSLLSHTAHKAPEAFVDPDAKAEVKAHMKELDDEFNSYFTKSQ